MSGTLDQDKASKTSNHHFCMQAFRDIGYEVTYKQVNPQDVGCPTSRSRVHYVGLLVEAIPNAASLLQVVLQCWKHVDEEVGKQFGGLPLRYFLYGTWRCEAVSDKKSARDMLSAVNRSSKKQKENPVWRSIHQKLREEFQALQRKS